jgi:Dolichyl-phosphate-mannose-protein mannosyltransferase
VSKWNEEVTVLAWARLPMLLPTLALGWIVFVYGRQLGGEWAGLLCLTVFASTPAFLTFGPLVLTDIPVTFYSLSTIWRFADLWENPTKWNSFLFAMSIAHSQIHRRNSHFRVYCLRAEYPLAAPSGTAKRQNRSTCLAKASLEIRLAAAFSGPPSPSTCSISFSRFARVPTFSI